MSNDHPYSEYLFRIFKYCPHYSKKGFGNIDSAHQWVKGFVNRYYEEHWHSAIRYVTPCQCHNREDHKILTHNATKYIKSKATKARSFPINSTAEALAMSRARSAAKRSS